MADASTLHPRTSCADLAGERIATLYPVSAYERAPPHLFLSEDREFRATMLTCNFRQSSAALEASAIYRFEDAVLWHNCLYVRTPGGRALLADLRRAFETEIWAPEANRIPAICRTVSAPHVFIGSAGSKNYGHFLVDDLPRFKAALIVDAPIALTSYGGIDAVKQSAATHIGAQVSFVDAREPVEFKTLYFATPVTMHPRGKNIAAMRWARSAFPNADGEGKLFVARRHDARRALTNFDEVHRHLEQRGFSSIEPERLSFLEQVKLFRRSHKIAGVMGAAMTTSLFSPAGAKVLHLAPDHWGETFYWDLASVSGHAYGAAHGARHSPGDAPHESAFSIPLDQLEMALTLMGDT